MLLSRGNKLLVAHRRLFETDQERFFVGQVEDYEAGVVKVRGHSYVRDVMSGLVIEKAEERTKILGLSSGTFLVYQLPDSVVVDTLKFEIDEGRLSLTDGRGFQMNLTEHTHAGKV